MRILRPAYLLLALCVITAAGCVTEADTDADFLQCFDKCDGAGPLSVSARWVPVGGFVRATITGEAGLSVTPANGSAIEDRGGRYIVTFAQPGFYTLSASGISGASLKIRVSDEGPTLALEGDAQDGFATTTNGKIRLYGTVKDTLGGTLRAKYGDVAMTIDGGGRFDITVPAESGANMASFELRDEADVRFRSFRSVIAAASFGQGESEGSVTISNAAMTKVANELAPRLPSLLDPRFPQGLIAEKLGHKLYLDSITLPGQAGTAGTLALELGALDGNRFRAHLRANGRISMKGRITGLFSIDSIVARVDNASVTVVVRFVNGTSGISAVVESAVANIPDPKIDASGIIPDAVFEWAIGDIGARLTKALEEKLAPLITKVLTGAERTVQLPGLNETTIPAHFRVSALELDGQKSTVRVAGSIAETSRVNVGPGTPQLAGTVSPPSGSSLGASVNLNILNQALYRLWEADQLRYTLTEDVLRDKIDAIPQLAALDPVLDVVARATLPPVVDFKGSRARVTIPELAITLNVSTDLFQVTIDARISGRLAGALAVVDGALTVEPNLDALHIDLSQRAFSGLNTEVAEALLIKMAPELFEKIASKLKAVPIPAIHLDGLGITDVGVVFANPFISFASPAVQVAAELQFQPR